MLTPEKILQIINRILRLNLDLETTPLDAELKSLGIDSLDGFSLIVELEAMTGKKVPDEEVEKLSTIRELLNYFS